MPKTMKSNNAEEIIKISKGGKKVYHYVDRKNKIDIKSKEINVKTKKIIHYPFRPKNGDPKYKVIRKIAYENLGDPLPRGFLKKFTTGYGFTRELNPLLYYLEKIYPHIQNVIVVKNKKSILKAKQVIFNLKDLSSAAPKIALMLKAYKEERDFITNNILSSIFPKKFTKRKETYKKGQLNSFIGKYALTSGDLSKDDIKSISDLLSSLSPEHEFIKKYGILTTKESVDKVFIEDILERYNELLLKKIKSRNLERKWQEFFSDNILYFNFGYIERIEKSRIQGDVSIDIPDFILINNYNYMDVFEIKTHLTQLLSYDKGRGNFYWSSEASKAISQSENYIDSIAKEEDRIIKNIRDEYDINYVNAVRPTVYIIASSKKQLAGSKTEKYSSREKRKLNNDFRRLNNSLKSIKFVLYDELLEVFNNMLNRLKVKD